MQYYHHPTAPETPAARWDENAFELFNRIPPVVILIPEGRGIHAIEHVNASKLMRDFDRLGKSGVRMLAIFTGEGVMEKQSLRALNLYLRHGAGLEAFRRAPDLYRNRHPFHKFGWLELKRLMSLRFMR